MASPVDFDVQYYEKRDGGECECQNSLKLITKIHTAA